MTKEEAIEILEKAAEGKAEREKRLQAEGYPAYTTQAIVTLIITINRYLNLIINVLCHFLSKDYALLSTFLVIVAGRLARILRQQGQVAGQPLSPRGFHRLQDEGRQRRRGRQEEASGMRLFNNGWKLGFIVWVCLVRNSLT